MLALAIVDVKQMEAHNQILEQGTAGTHREAMYWAGRARGLARPNVEAKRRRHTHAALPM